MSLYVQNPLADWHAAINQRFDLITDPERQWSKLVGLATLAHGRRQVDKGGLSEMLEQSDAARLWALSELEEAGAVGLFCNDATESGERPHRFQVRSW